HVARRRFKWRRHMAIWGAIGGTLAGVDFRFAPPAYSAQSGTSARGSTQGVASRTLTPAGASTAPSEPPRSGARGPIPSETRTLEGHLPQALPVAHDGAQTVFVVVQAPRVVGGVRLPVRVGEAEQHDGCAEFLA